MRKHYCRILMLSESSFPGDIRPKNEAYTLTKAGYKVTFIALRKNNGPIKEKIEGVQVYRIPQLTLFKKARKPNPSFIQQKINRVKSIVGYLFEYVYFTTASFLLSFYIFIKEGFDVIHLHNPPDTLFIIGTFYKLLGKKFVFDHHDLSPELYRTRFSGKKDVFYSSLMAFERLSCKVANIVICTNNSYKQIEMNRHSIAADKIYIVRNNPVVSEYPIQDNDKNIKKEGDKTVLLFLGAINPQDGVDNLLNILYLLVNNLNQKGFVCNIVGDGDSLQSIKLMAKELNLLDYIDFKGRVIDRHKVIEYLFLADICIEPAPENYLNHHSTFIKTMEYMMAVKPIVAYDLKETRYSTDGSAILIKPGEIEEFAHAIARLMDNPKLRRELGDRGHERIVKDLNWRKASLNLLDAYKRLAS